MNAVASFFVGTYATDAALVRTTRLRDDLWLDDLALCDLADHLRTVGFDVDLSRLEAATTVGDVCVSKRREAAFFLSRPQPPTQDLLGPPAPPAVNASARWVVDVASWKPTDAEWQRALALVPPETRDRAARYRLQDDKLRHVVGQIALRKLIHTHTGVPYGDIVFSFTKGLKPVLGPALHARCPHANYNFNYSHEGSFVACATEPVCLVGVDVALIEVRGRDKSISAHFDLMKPSFTRSEWIAIRVPGLSEQEQLRRFFVFWALKESYTKATGWGMGTEFSTIEFRGVFDAPWESNTAIGVVVAGVVCRDWHFRVRMLGDNHVLAVAVGPARDAAPTFKATFKLPASSADLWGRVDVPPSLYTHVEFLTVEQLLEGVEPWH